jgi:hypothetical protein
MMRAIPQQVTEAPSRTARAATIAFAAGAGLLVAATAALWTYYGTAVFYETIIAGINACF